MGKRAGLRQVDAPAEDVCALSTQPDLQSIIEQASGLSPYSLPPRVLEHLASLLADDLATELLCGLLDFGALILDGN